MKLSDSALLSMENGKLFSDEPISNFEDDICNRRPFCEALAKSITNLFSKEKSKVVGLEGRWGDGKTSVVTLTETLLDPSIEIIKFNPWRYTEKSQINFTQAFFNNLHKSILGRSTSQENRQLAASLALYAALLQPSNVPKNSSALLNSILMGVALIVGIAPVWLMPVAEFLEPFKWVFYVGSAVFAFAPAVIIKFKNMFHALSEQKTDLDFVKGQIHFALSQSNRRFLIIIDNLDRATGAEIYELTQIIKINADFPQVVFLLCYDVEILSAQLRNVVSLNGVEYLKKIIQIQVPIPAMLPERVERYLREGFDSVLFASEIDYSAVLSKNYQLRIFGLRLQPLILNLRDLKRTLNGFSHKLEIVGVNKVAELNPLDLFCLEIIYHGWPELYYFIQRQQSIFTGGTVLDWLGTNQAERNTTVRSRADAFFDLDLDKRKEKYLPLLTELFPEIAKAYGQPSISDGVQNNFRRVCAVRYFPVYFNLSGIGSMDGVSEFEINELRKSFALGSEAIFKGLELFVRDNKIEAVLRRIDELTEDSSFISDVALDGAVKALCNIIPFLYQGGEERNFGNQIWIALRLCFKLLLRLKKLGRSEKVMYDLISFSSNYAAAAELLRFEEVNHEKKASDLLFSDEQLRDMKVKWVQSVSFNFDSSSEDRVEPIRRVLEVLKLWAPEALRDKTEKILEWGYRLSKVITAFVVPDPEHEAESDFWNAKTIDFVSLNEVISLFTLQQAIGKALEDQHVNNRPVLQLFMRKLPQEMIAKEAADFEKQQMRNAHNDF